MTRVLLSALAIAISSTAASAADVFKIFEFDAGAPGIAIDHFNDGSPPPSGPGNANFYAVFGTFGPEVNNPGGVGGLSIDPSAGALSNTPGGTPLHVNVATARTPQDASQVGAIVQTNSFDMYGIFENVAPTVSGESYGVRLQNFTAPGVGGSNVVYVAMFRDGTGTVQVGLFQQDFVNGTSQIVASHALGAAEAAAQLVQLTLFHPLNATTVQASFCFSDSGGCNVSSIVQLGTANVFATTAWMQGAFLAAVPVPEPSAFVLFSAGLVVVAIVGWRRRTMTA